MGWERPATEGGARAWGQGDEGRDLELHWLSSLARGVCSGFCALALIRESRDKDSVRLRQGNSGVPRTGLSPGEP